MYTICLHTMHTCTYIYIHSYHVHTHTHTRSPFPPAQTAVAGVSLNPFFSTVPTCAVRETEKPLRDDSVLRALSSLRGLRGAPEVPPLCRETQSLGQQMLNAPVSINGLQLRDLYEKRNKQFEL